MQLSGLVSIISVRREANDRHTTKPYSSEPFRLWLVQWTSGEAAMSKMQQVDLIILLIELFPVWAFVCSVFNP